jgi:hypothetical protein
MKMQKLLLLAGVSLALVSAASTSYAGFSVADYFGRYACELHPLEGSSDKAGAVLLIYPDGGGKFTAGTLVGAWSADQQCPFSLCKGTSCLAAPCSASPCSTFTFSSPSSYKVGPDGRGTSTENYYRVGTVDCDEDYFTTTSTFLLSADGRKTKVVYSDSLEDSNEVWGDKRAVGDCFADPRPSN